jgi:hypothetical protein
LDENGEGDASCAILALERLRKLNAASKQIAVDGVNVSLGYPFDLKWYGCGHSPLCEEVNRTVQSGIIVVISCGNAGYGRQPVTSAAASKHPQQDHDVVMGHEHNLVIFDKYQGVYGQYIGHGAFPVGIDVPEVRYCRAQQSMPRSNWIKAPAPISTASLSWTSTDPPLKLLITEDSSPNTALYQEQIAADGTVTP